MRSRVAGGLVTAIALLVLFGLRSQVRGAQYQKTGSTIESGARGKLSSSAPCDVPLPFAPLYMLLGGDCCLPPLLRKKCFSVSVSLRY